jgi:hypothetical protein
MLTSKLATEHADFGTKMSTPQLSCIIGGEEGVWAMTLVLSVLDMSLPF